MAAPNLQLIAAGAEPRDEAEFQVAVVEYALAHGWSVQYFIKSAAQGKNGKWHGLAPPGWPDLFMVREEVAIAAELKSRTGTTTPEQRKWLSLLAGVKDGAIKAVVWKPVDASDILGVLK